MNRFFLTLDANHHAARIEAGLQHVTVEVTTKGNTRELLLDLAADTVSTETELGVFGIGLEDGLVAVELPRFAAVLAKMHARPVREWNVGGTTRMLYDLASPVAVRLPYVGRVSFRRAERATVGDLLGE